MLPSRLPKDADDRRRSLPWPASRMLRGANPPLPLCAVEHPRPLMIDLPQDAANALVIQRRVAGNGASAAALIGDLLHE